jgi:opacity protein-like surface antigen
LNRWLLFAGTLLAASVVCAAQSLPVSNEPSTLDFFVGGTFQRGVGSTSVGNHYGWDTSLTERPYLNHPWIGGTVEASGAYQNSSYTVAGTSIRVDGGVYTFMGGPSVAFRLNRAQPFARVLLGTVIGTAAASVGNQNSRSASSTYFGMSVGGGVDVPLTQNFALRGQADWLWSKASDLQSINMVRTSVGGVFRF